MTASPAGPRLAANLTLLFTDRPLIDRLLAARRAGFDAVEILFPYDLAPETLAALLAGADLPLVLVNTPVPDWAEGGRGTAALPALEARFRDEFLLAREMARTAGAGLIHVMTGVGPADAAHVSTLLDNLAWAADEAPDLTLCLEPLNPADFPGYMLGSFDLAADLLDRLARPNVRLQFDAYHAARLTGDAATVWAAHGPRAAHVQIASAPSRAEPGPAEIALLRRIAASGYTGTISAEYHPANGTEAGLGWLAPARAALGKDTA